MLRSSSDRSRTRVRRRLRRPSARAKLAASLTLAAMSLGSELQWVVTAYTIAFAAFILTAGALGDRLGAKRIFIAGFAIFTLASLACALAPSAMFLIAARSVQRLAAAVLAPNSLTLLHHAYAA